MTYKNNFKKTKSMTLMSYTQLRDWLFQTNENEFIFETTKLRSNSFLKTVSGIFDSPRINGNFGRNVETWGALMKDYIQAFNIHLILDAIEIRIYLPKSNNESRAQTSKKG